MLIYATIVALCLLADAQARVVELTEESIQDRCTRNSVTWVSCEDKNSPDGLVPHPDDCNLFYYCLSPVLPPVCRQCPAGLHFNPILRVCDWPQQAGCVANNTRGRCDLYPYTSVSCDEVNSSDSLVPHPDDCNLFFYCLNSDLPPVCRHCPANLHFNPVLHVCDWPEEAGCAGVTTTVNTTEWPGDITDTTFVPTTEWNETETTSDPWENRCALYPNEYVSCEEASPGTNFTHPYDCSLYFHCSHPLLPSVCMECLHGFHYNSTTQGCDLPWIAGCTVTTTAGYDDFSYSTYETTTYTEAT